MFDLDVLDRDQVAANPTNPSADTGIGLVVRDNGVAADAPTFGRTSLVWRSDDHAADYAGKTYPSTLDTTYRFNVTGAVSAKSAHRIAMCIANSPLVKTAIAGEDANWGRIVMAVGKAGEPADRDKLGIAVGGTWMAQEGSVVPGYDETPVVAHMKGREVEITVDIGGQTVVAAITRGSAEELALAEGDQVTVLIKATEVMLGK